MSSFTTLNARDTGAVLFDLDGTLYRQFPVRLAIALRLFVEFVRSPRGGWRSMRCIRAFRRAQEGLRSAGALEGDPWRVQVECAALACGMPAGEADLIVSKWLLEMPLPYLRRAMPAEVPPLLERLKKGGVKVGVVSDYPAREKLRALGLEQYVDVVVEARDPRVKAFKPDPRGLTLAAERLGVDASRCLYAGDREAVDGVAARAAGMDFVLVQPAWLGYFQLLRVDHWTKNVFVLPGVPAAISMDAVARGGFHWTSLLLGLLSAGAIASSNYVLNAILDAPFDRTHPEKRNRPVPSGQVRVSWAYAEWIVLMAAGLWIGYLVSPLLSWTNLALWLMGCVYNVPPVRTKDLPVLDVLTEAINNPLRLLAGWFLTGSHVWPPGSLLLSYWMVGAFFMAVKRFAEYREAGENRWLAQYRRSFAFYNERRLLVSIMFYAAHSMLFLGAFVVRYRLELVLAFPFVAAVMATYLSLAFEKHSPAQYPEGLYRDRRLLFHILLCAVVMTGLLFVDIPGLRQFIDNPPMGQWLERK